MNRLVDKLLAQGVLRSPEVVNVMRTLDRRLFCPRRTPPDLCYHDHPLEIGMGQTISAPHVHALALEACRDRLQQVDRETRVSILDVGSGSGYLCGAFSLLLEEMGFVHGSVTGIEKYKELVKRSIESLEEAGLGRLLRSSMLVEQFNGYEYAPSDRFDFIHCGAAAEFLPQNLVDALKEGGQMILPLGPHGGVQVMTLVTKGVGGRLRHDRLMDVRYVPLQL
jgi:protein-L-isoaspartate(D-aspartate) O-methyltransferase